MISDTVRQCKEEDAPTLWYVAEGVREGAARDGAAEPDACADSLHHRAVRTMLNLACAEVLCVGGLRCVSTLN